MGRLSDFANRTRTAVMLGRTSHDIPFDVLEETDPEVFGPSGESEATLEDYEAALRDKIASLYSVDGDWNVYLEDKDKWFVVKIDRFAGIIAIDGRRPNPELKAAQANTKSLSKWEMSGVIEGARLFALSEGNSYHREWEVAPPLEELCGLAWNAWRQFQGPDELPVLTHSTFQTPQAEEIGTFSSTTVEPGTLLWRILPALGVGSAFWRLDVGIILCIGLGISKALIWPRKPSAPLPEIPIGQWAVASCSLLILFTFFFIGAATVGLWLSRELSLAAIAVICLSSIAYYASLFLVRWIMGVLLPCLFVNQRRSELHSDAEEGAP